MVVSEILHPVLGSWVTRKFGTLTDAQQKTLPYTLAGKSVLLSSPTGSGKTLAGFLGILDWLIRVHEGGGLPLGIVAVYVSPLRALSYDLQKNLQSPLAEMGLDYIRVGLRTGDTSPKDRAAQKRKPPHILITTPESLTLMLSQASYEPAFARSRFLVIDELHSLAENKRGALMMLTAERLQHSVESTPEGKLHGLIRVGLSATVSPLPVMAQFLCGGRPCEIVEVLERKRSIVEVFSPLRKNPYPPAGWTAGRVMGELAEVVRSKQTTLIFSNTRSGAEIIGLRLKEAMPDLAELIEVHHASLDRSIRLAVEDRLKAGTLRAVVCSSSLELGIDIGSIDLVVMISAPKGVARALQRLGRSGHSIHASSHGLLVATNINDLVECAATAKQMENKRLEPLKIANHPLDVLAQFVVGLALTGSPSPEDAYQMAKQAWPYREMRREDFDRILRYLQGGGSCLEGHYTEQFGKIVIIDGRLFPASKKVVREYYQNIGTIASESMIQVRLPKRRKLGQVEESFIKKLQPGDVFVLNGQVVRLIETRLLEARVKPAPGEWPTIPRWNTNKMPLGSGVAEEVTRLRTESSLKLDQGGSAARDWLVEEYSLSASNAEAVVRQFEAQRMISTIPVAGLFLIEVFREEERLHCLFHSLIGRAANDALSRIMSWRLKKVKGGNALVTIDDYGFLLTIRDFQEMDLEEWQALFDPANAEQDLHEALREAQLVKWQFRGVSQTGLMVPRRRDGAERKPRALQWSAEILFEVLIKHEPDHPLLEEAYREAMHTFLDLPRAVAFLEQAGGLSWEIKEVPKISPFAFGIFVSKIKEGMMMENAEEAVERLYFEMYRELGEVFEAP